MTCLVDGIQGRKTTQTVDIVVGVIVVVVLLHV